MLGQLFLTLLLPAAAAQGLTVGILAPPRLMIAPTARMAISDSTSFLAKGFPGATVILNPPDAQVLLILPEPAKARELRPLSLPHP